MTYEQAGAAWVGTAGTVILMSKWLWQNVESLFGDFAEEINSMNANLGLDYSVDAEDIALDYLVQFRSGAMAGYLKRNEFPRDKYISELNDEVGRPYSLVLSAALLAALLGVAFSGPLVYHLWGLSPATEYFSVLYALILANLAAYFLL